MAERAALRLVQLEVLDKMLYFICRLLLVLPLFLEILLAFVIMLHFGVATVLLGRETAVQMLVFSYGTVPIFLSGLGGN